MEINDITTLKPVDTENNFTLTAKIRTSGFNSQIYTSEMGNGNKVHFAIACSIGDCFVDALSGKNAEEALKLLVKAVNNRTIERDYFRLYCDLLDGTLSEEEFDRTIEEHPNDYIIEENEEISTDTALLALNLAKHIKDVNSIEDLSSLFSFNQKQLISYSVKHE